jgi:branched-chain amino acid transport system substrate-binding protein
MKFKYLALALAITSMSLAACGDKKSAGNVIKIAASAPLTGSSADAGADHNNGAQLAVDEINAKGGVEINGVKHTLELVSEDDGGDPKQGATVAQKIVDNQDISAVIAHYNSGVTKVAQPLYATRNLVTLTISTNPELTAKAVKGSKGETLLYRMDAHDAQQGPALASYAHDKGLNKIAILDDATTYGKGLADEVEGKAKSLGMTLVSHASVNDKTTDFKGVLSEIKHAGADTIMWGGYDSAGATLVKQARELGMNTVFLMPDGVCTQNYKTLAGANADGSICSATGIPLSDMKDGADFSARYEKRFPGLKVQSYSPYTYDAVLTLVAAIKKANSAEPAKIAAAMQGISATGMSGNIAFDDATGERKDSFITISEVKNMVSTTVAKITK